MPHSGFRALCLAFLCLSILSSGCSSRQTGTAPLSQRGYGSPSSSAGGPMFFTPLEQSGAFLLSQAQAEELSRKLLPRQQGLGAWQDLDFAVRQSLAYAQSRPKDSIAISASGLTLTYGELSATLRRLQDLLPALDKQPSLLARDFSWYRLGPDFHCTGYFEPTLRASRKKSAAYPYPLYRVPPDLRQGVAYYTRRDIDRKGVLAGRGLELAWVSSEMDAFFLHIQGSGRLVFEDGSETHVLYAGKNNRAYVPLGRVMRDQGLLAPDNINMRAIRECLLGNPEKCAELYDSNPSYVFFREAAQGPVGAMGRPLTPYVSIATDRSVLPHGSLIFATTALPDATGKPGRAFHGLLLPQDTGGAIKKRRIDLFCGPGEEAAHNAGYMDYPGAVYILIKK